jgi:hypothetical protein
MAQGKPDNRLIGQRGGVVRSDAVAGAMWLDVSESIICGFEFPYEPFGCKLGG